MSIQRIPYSKPRSDFITALQKDGCVVVTGFTDDETLEQARKEVQPFLDAEEVGSTVGALNGGTRTCTRLVGRSKTAREKWFSDALYQVCSFLYFLEIDVNIPFINSLHLPISHLDISRALALPTTP